MKTDFRHPVIDGVDLRLGHLVRTTPGHHTKSGIVTGIHVRCLGRADELDVIKEFDEDGKYGPIDGFSAWPEEQVWIELDGQNEVFEPHDIEEILR